MADKLWQRALTSLSQNLKLGRWHRVRGETERLRQSNTASPALNLQLTHPIRAWKASDVTRVCLAGAGGMRLRATPCDFNVIAS